MYVQAIEAEGSVGVPGDREKLVRFRDGVFFVQRGRCRGAVLRDVIAVRTFEHAHNGACHPFAGSKQVEDMEVP